jgi:hypothetical protein
MEVIVRRLPRMHWIRIGVSLAGDLEASWTPEPLYKGIVTRIAWPVFGRGPYVLICWSKKCRMKTARWMARESRSDAR